MSDIEGKIARVDCNAARVAGASTGSASDQGKVARVATSKLGDERVSNPGVIPGRCLQCGLLAMELMGLATWKVK